MRRNKHLEKRVAQDRIDTLFTLAEREALDGNWARADRYVGLARNIGMRYNVPTGQLNRLRLCRGCHAFLMPSATAKIRVGRDRITCTCLKCGRVTRFPYSRERGERRRAAAGRDNVAAAGERKETEAGGK